MFSYGLLMVGLYANVSYAVVEYEYVDIMLFSLLFYVLYVFTFLFTLSSFIHHYFLTFSKLQAN